jgi:hypothetical protein
MVAKEEGYLVLSVKVDATAANFISELYIAS